MLKNEAVAGKVQTISSVAVRHPMAVLINCNNSIKMPPLM